MKFKHRGIPSVWLVTYWALLSELNRVLTVLKTGPVSNSEESYFSVSLITFSFDSTVTLNQSIYAATRRLRSGKKTEWDYSNIKLYKAFLVIT